MCQFIIYFLTFNVNIKEYIMSLKIEICFKINNISKINKH